MEEVNKSTKNLGDVKRTNSDNEKPQVVIENIPPHQALETNEGEIYDLELENTLKNMEKDKTGFFKTYHDPQRGWTLIIYPIKTLRGTEVEINDNKYNITPGLQKVFTDKTYKTAKSMNDKDKVAFRDILLKTGYYNRILSKSRMSGRDKYIQSNLDDNVSRVLNLDDKHECRGVEKIIIPSNLIDIYTKLEVIIELNLSGHTDALTEASNLIDEIYKRGGIQNEQQYRNALSNFSTH